MSVLWALSFCLTVWIFGRDWHTVSFTPPTLISGAVLIALGLPDPQEQMLQRLCGDARKGFAAPSRTVPPEHREARKWIHSPGVRKVQETQQSQECDNTWSSFPDLHHVGPCKVIIVRYFTAQKDTTVAHLSLLFLVLPVVSCQMLALPDLPFSFLCLASFLCFSSAFPNIVLPKLCVFPDVCWVSFFCRRDTWSLWMETGKDCLNEYWFQNRARRILRKLVNLSVCFSQWTTLM